jgi:hypothetical protein
MAALFFFASFPVFTRSLAFARRGYYICKTTKFRSFLTHFVVFASVAPCVLAVAQPPAINLKRNAQRAKVFDLFR